MQMGLHLYLGISQNVFTSLIIARKVFDTVWGCPKNLNQKLTKRSLTNCRAFACGSPQMSGNLRSISPHAGDSVNVLPKSRKLQKLLEPPEIKKKIFSVLIHTTFSQAGSDASVSLIFYWL
jgi:hypothetical protein